MAKKNSPTVSVDLLDAAYAMIKSGAATRRSDLVRAMGISASTASNVARSLTEQNLIREIESRRSTGGRPAKVLQSTQGSEVVAVAEVGSHHLRFGLADSIHPLQCIDEVLFDTLGTPEEAMSTLVEQWEKLRAAAFPEHSIGALGISIASPVEAESRRLVLPARLPGWHHADLRQILFDLTGLPAWIENDTRACALGELPYSPVESFIYVKAGTGIGGALVIDGELYQGAGGFAGDISHSRVDPDMDDLCACGRRGCLEAIASGATIRKRALAAGLDVEDRSIVTASLSDVPEINPFVRQSAELIGRALGPIVNFINPGAIYVGGALSGLGVFMSSLRASVFNVASSTASQDLIIEPAPNGANAPLMGVAREAFRLAGASCKKG
ncbi:ROK family protein [Trueperella pyogenes]|uniref:ROK family transcriptional regulator n=1 Tax=Trueperella pyogenes TaxID=1661 RepID=UPI00324A26AE